MRFYLLLMVCFLMFIGAFAESLEKKVNYYKISVISGQGNVLKFYRVIARLSELKTRYYELLYSLKADKKQADIIKEKLSKLQQEMYTTYGVIPDIRLRRVIEKAELNLLLTPAQWLRYKSNSKPGLKEESEKLQRYKIRDLNNAKEVQDFLNLLKKRAQLTKSLEIAGAAKENLQEAQTKLTELDVELKKSYNINGKLDYLVDPLQISLYMVITNSELSALAQANQRLIKRQVQAQYKKLNLAAAKRNELISGAKDQGNGLKGKE
ncbi:MAG: hypothetical protein HRT88_09240 [Lentisphaeraceae bacterium]|nr:hypothetical protein [Lentisphaeraceae bacterium]